MPPLSPLKRKEFIYFLRKAGFTGPFSGGKHQIMKKINISLRIPNPHQSEIGKDLILRILKQAGISREEWEQM